MATPEEVATLRLLIAEPTEDTYTDTDLMARLDVAGATQDMVAYQIWTEKAAAAASLVDVSEGGSSRKMGDLYEQALDMARVFGERASAAELPPGVSGPSVRLKRLVRP